jgi:DNA-binding NarL/FixJ family response regulator
MKSARVFLVDDHAVVRQGFRSLLAGDERVEVVGEASGGEEAIELLERTPADVVVMDVNMKGMDGLMTARKVMGRHPGMKVLILSMYEDAATVRQAIQVGVAGYLVKSTDTAEFLKAIREIIRGNAYFSPSIQRLLAELSAKSAPAAVELTVRDQELLRLIGAGKSNREISTVLCISVKSVEKYRQHLMDKVDIHDVAGLTRFAIERGILKLK